MRTSLALASTLLLAAHPAPAQTPASPALLNQLVANAQQYRATLPSITADESIVSDVSYLFFKRHAEARGTFRVLRPAPGQSGLALEESRQITTLNGKPVEPSKHPTLPATLFGGFGRFQEMFFTPQNLHCFTFTQLPTPGPAGTIEITITGPPQPEPDPTCSADRVGLTGLVRLDPATHQVVHLERTIPPEIAARTSLAPFASVDLAPTRIGDDTFWLPTTVTGQTLNGKLRGSFVAHYSNYHRYTASITLLPGATEVPPPQ